MNEPTFLRTAQADDKQEPAERADEDKASLLFQQVGDPPRISITQHSVP
jgi:hypothetical protein